MGGIVEELNPEQGLRNLSRTGFEYRLAFKGLFNSSELCFNVININLSVRSAFLLKFTKAINLKGSPYDEIIEQDCLMFDPKTVKVDTEKRTVSILLCDPDEPDNSDFIFHLENIKTLIRMPKERIGITKEDIMNSESFRKAFMPRDRSLFGVFKSLFGK